MLKNTAITHFGSQKQLATALGITSGAISQWGDVVPEGQAYKLQTLTKGVLKVDPACYAKPTTEPVSP